MPSLNKSSYHLNFCVKEEFRIKETSDGVLSVELANDTVSHRTNWFVHLNESTFKPTKCIRSYGPLRVGRANEVNSQGEGEECEAKKSRTKDCL